MRKLIKQKNSKMAHSVYYLEGNNLLYKRQNGVDYPVEVYAYKHKQDNYWVLATLVNQICTGSKRFPTLKACKVYLGI